MREEAMLYKEYTVAPSGEHGVCFKEKNVDGSITVHKNDMLDQICEITRICNANGYEARFEMEEGMKYAR